MEKNDPVSASDASEVPRLELTPEEKKAIDDAIRIMVRLYSRRIEGVPSFEQIHGNVCIYGPLDSLISDTLKSLKRDVPDRPAEKLFDQIACAVVNEGDDSGALGVIYVRMMNTMECIVAVKGEFRGRKIRQCRYTKEQAFKLLQERGLTRR